MLFRASLIAVAVVSATSAGAQSGGIAVIASGSEQALQIGDTVVTRPFGAQLVDRINIVGTYRNGARTFHLIRGDAGGDCPARYAVVTRDTAGGPTVTEPFGTCSKGARGESGRDGFAVAMPATVAGGPLVRFRYDGGAMRLVNAAPAAGVAGGDGMVGFAARSASTCRTPTSADPATQSAVVAEFEANYPAEYRKMSSLKRAEIDPDELRATVTGLACLARWPGAEEVVPAAATPLFSSKRHGAAAFALIDTIARDPLSDVNLRAAVRAFGAEMTYRVDRREPL